MSLKLGHWTLNARKYVRCARTFYFFANVAQVAQAARRLATGLTARVRSRVAEGWSLFFTHSYPVWSWGLLSLLKMSTGGGGKYSRV